MANITNPQVVKWSNERTRTLANKGAAFCDIVAQHTGDYINQGIQAKITAEGSSNVVDDAATTDGRPIITGDQIINLRVACNWLNTTVVPGIGITFAAICSAIQDSGSPR